MKRKQVIGVVGFCSCLLFPAFVGAEENTDAPSGKSESKTFTIMGETVSRVGNSVAETVTITVNTVEPIVTETLHTTTKAVTSTTDFVEKTSDTLTTSQKPEKVVTTVVEDAKQLVDETVKDTADVVRETVRDVVAKVPEASVVKPVAEKADHVVGDLTATIDQTTKKTDSVAEETVNPSGLTVKIPAVAVGSMPEQSDSVGNDIDHSLIGDRPMDVPDPIPLVNKESALVGHVEIAGMPAETKAVERKLSESFAEADFYHLSMLAADHVDVKQRDKDNHPFQHEGMNGLQFPFVSLQPSSMVSVGKTASSSPAFTGSDQPVAITVSVNNLAKLITLSLYFDGEFLKTQWSNAPPEQPPCSTPFYFI